MYEHVPKSPVTVIYITALNLSLYHSYDHVRPCITARIRFLYQNYEHVPISPV